MSDGTDWCFDGELAPIFRERARMLIRSGYFPSADFEDIQQDLALHLFSKSDRYDGSRGALVAFARTVTKRKALSMIRRARAARRLAYLVPLEVPVDAADAESGEERTRAATEVAEPMALQVEDLIDLARLTDAGDQRERELCRAVMLNGGLARACRELGMPRATGQYVLKRIRIRHRDG